MIGVSTRARGVHKYYGRPGMPDAGYQMPDAGSSFTFKFAFLLVWRTVPASCIRYPSFFVVNFIANFVGISGDGNRQGLRQGLRRRERIRHPASGNWHPVSSYRHLASGIWYPVSGSIGVFYLSSRHFRTIMLIFISC